MATIIDGKAVAAELRQEIARDVDAYVAESGRKPGLATILVGDDSASAVYVSNKQKACAEVGIEGFSHKLAPDTQQAEVVGLINDLNVDDRVDGILLQLPVPDHLDGQALTDSIAPRKDVDGLTPISAGLLALGRPGLVPCTPWGIMELLDRYKIEIEGRHAVVVGRSNLVGKPIAQLLLMRNATVTLCHSRTQNLSEVCAQADILIAAVGRPKMITAEFVKPGSTVIDVGISRGEDGLVGDVDFDSVAEVAGVLTPVPGGVGPMTIASLLRNTLTAARK